MVVKKVSTLQTRRIMADLTTCYKLLNSLIDIDSTNFLVASINLHTKGNSRKLTKNHRPPYIKN